MKNFQSFITEENVNDGDIQIAVLTKVSSKEKEIVANQIKEYADKNKIPKLGIHMLSGLKRKKKKAIIIAKGNLVICSAICCAKYLKNGFKG